MTKDQYLRTLNRLGLSKVGAGRVLGLSPRQAQRLASGESPVPAPVERLLAMWSEHGIPAQKEKGSRN